MDTKLTWDFTNSSPTEDLRSKWITLCENNSKSCISSYPIFSKSSQQLLSNPEIIYAYAHDETNNIVSVIPLYVKSKNICFLSCKVLQIINHDHLDVYVIAGQNLWDFEALINSFISSIRTGLKGWDYFQARNLKLETPLSRKYKLPFYKKESAYFNLSNAQNLNEVVPKKLFKNITRLQKKLSTNEQELRLECYDSEGSIGKALDKFIEIEDSGWKGESKTSIKSNDSIYNFYNDIWNGFSNSDEFKTQIYLLYLNDTAIAGSISYRHNDSIYLHKIAYEDSLTEFGPGSILVKLILEKEFQAKEVTTLCLNTNPKWANRWHPKVYSLEAIESFNNNFKGLTLKVFFCCYRTAKRIKNLLDERIKKVD